MEYAPKFQKELQTQLKTSVPASLNALGNSLPWLISIGFVGRIGSKELAAAALATSICNVTGLSLSMGLSSAIATLTGQSKGDINQRREKMMKHVNVNVNVMDDIELRQASLILDITQPMTPKTYLYRGIFVQLMFVLPVGIYWLYGMKPLLIAMGQNEIIADMAEKYLQIMTPGFWCYSINYLLSSWLQAIGMADIPIYGVLVGTVLHIPMNILFIYVLDMGYLGAAVASSIFRFIQPFVTTIIICMTAKGTQRIHVNTGADTIYHPIPLLYDIQRAVWSLKGILQYLSLAVPGIVNISTWWASEVTILLAGQLSHPDIALASMTIYQSIINLCFKYSMGVSIACATRVSNLLGAGDGPKAQFASHVSTIYATVTVFVMAFGLYTLPHTLVPSLFTNDAEILSQVAKTIPYLALYVFADGMQITFNGVIKGCGRQCVVMPMVLFSYWMVGVPLSYMLAFQLDAVHNFVPFIFSMQDQDGIIGLTTGMAIGSWTLFSLVGLSVCCFTDWKKEVVNAQLRMGIEHKRKTTHQNITQTTCDVENNIKVEVNDDVLVNERTPLTSK